MVSKTVVLDLLAAAIIKNGGRIKEIIVNAPTTKVGKKKANKIIEGWDDPMARLFKKNKGRNCDRFDYWATLSGKSKGRNNGKN